MKEIEDMSLWSVFLKVHFEDKKWIKRHAFYYGDLSSIKTSKDSRFREVKGKRKNSVFLGLVKTNFPVKYPLILENGKTLQRI